MQYVLYLVYLNLVLYQVVLVLCIHPVPKFVEILAILVNFLVDPTLKRRVAWTGQDLWRVF